MDSETCAGFYFCYWPSSFYWTQPSAESKDKSWKKYKKALTALESSLLEEGTDTAWIPCFLQLLAWGKVPSMGQPKLEEKPAILLAWRIIGQNSRNYSRWKVSGKSQEEDSQVEEGPNSDFKLCQIFIWYLN